MALSQLIESELGRAPAPAVAEFAQALAARGGAGTAAVLFYGSALRTGALDGLLDYYVLLEEAGRWPGSRFAAFASRLLPPHVGYAEQRCDGQTLRAKYAVISVDRFARGMAEDSLDTTLWARFSQPCLLAWVRSPEDAAAMRDAICRAGVTAGRWAAGLGPERGNALDYWRILYAYTYDAELRVESALRGPGLIDSEAGRYARCLPLAWQAAGIDFAATADGGLEPRLSARERERAARRWAWRRRLGKPLNLLRLVKSAFTFDGAMDYVTWKVERHSGRRLELSPWQRRHPLLAAPGLYWRLRRQGILR